MELAGLEKERRGRNREKNWVSYNQANTRRVMEVGYILSCSKGILNITEKKGVKIHYSPQILGIVSKACSNVHSSQMPHRPLQ